MHLLCLSNLSLKSSERYKESNTTFCESNTKLQIPRIASTSKYNSSSNNRNSTTSQSEEAIGDKLAEHIVQPFPSS